MGSTGPQTSTSPTGVVADAEVTGERRTVGVPGWRSAAIQRRAAQEILAREAGDVRGHDAGRAGAPALIAEAAAVAFQPAVTEQPATNVRISEMTGCFLDFHRMIADA
jgi:hypothetical protein